MRQLYNIALIGNPNCGKTTIYNYLAKDKQSTGNWAGVTVKKTSGFFENNKSKIQVDDLPGVYSLNLANNNAEDQLITCNYIYENKTDLYINIIDASNIKRSLYLTLQLLETGKPCIIVLNMIDKVRHAKAINVKKLEKALGTNVLCLNSNNKEELKELSKYIQKSCENHNKSPINIFSKVYKFNIEKFAKIIDHNFSEYNLNNDNGISQKFLTAQLLEQNPIAFKVFNSQNPNNQLENNIQNYLNTSDDDLDLTIADLRYKAIHKIYKEIIKQPEISIKKHSKTKSLDKILLHKYFGLPIFLFLMYLTFEISISLGAFLKIPIEAYSNNISPVFFYNIFKILPIPDYISNIISNGLTYGITTTLGFLPQIFLIYICLAILEESGYMARAAFVMDRIMQIAKLPGKSFIPLIIGFGCNVPAIYATRTLENKTDRIITALMTPFMSCGARLAIFIVFASTFFPNNTGFVIFSLYILGIFIAILTSILLKKTLLKNSEDNHTILEIPDYNIPNLKQILSSAFNKLISFIKQAGKIIIIACLSINILNNIKVNSEDSVLAAIGKTLTPLFQPIGIEKDNWPAVVGIMTGAVAKEVTIGSLNTLYNNKIIDDQNSINNITLIEAFKQASIDTKNSLQNSSLIKYFNPITANASDAEIDSSSQHKLSSAFKTKAAAFAYCIFLLLYIPCISTFAALKAEVGKYWAYFSLIWSTSIAYSAAGIFYQASHLSTTGLSNILLIISFNITLFLTLKLKSLRYDHAF